MVAELGDGKARGRGECVPYARYGESVESVLAQIKAMEPRLAAGLDREALQSAMPPGAARNALDCAFWDLAAKQSGRPAHALAGLHPPQPLTTAYTISLAPPAAMAAAACLAVAQLCDHDHGLCLGAAADGEGAGDRPVFGGYGEG